MPHYLSEALKSLKENAIKITECYCPFEQRLTIFALFRLSLNEDLQDASCWPIFYT